jgi:hypothetical protein
MTLCTGLGELLEVFWTTTGSSSLGRNRGPGSAIGVIGGKISSFSSTTGSSTTYSEKVSITSSRNKSDLVGSCSNVSIFFSGEKERGALGTRFLGVGMMVSFSYLYPTGSAGN